MFGLLSSSQIYGLQQTPEHIAATEDSQKKSNSLPHKPHKQPAPAPQHRRSTSSLSDTGTGKFFANLGAKSPSSFIEKFIKSELLNGGYDALRSQSKTPAEKQATTPTAGGGLYSNLQTDWGGFSCLQGSYRSNCDGEFYEAVQIKPSTTTNSNNNNAEMTLRSKHLDAAPLGLYQKLGEKVAGDGQFNTQAAGHTPSYKKLSFGARLQKQSAEHNSDNSQSSTTATTTTTTTRPSSGSEVQRSSSGSSSSGGVANGAATSASPERTQRRKLLQMISNYDQQNKQLQRELAKEKRRRTEELACVVKSLLCFESKLKCDMKSVNQRLLDKDNEICRLVRQNRALRKRLESVECNRDEGMVEDQDVAEPEAEAECLVLEALQCNNCRKQFYDIELRASGTQTGGKEGGQKEANRKPEHGSSSDDTVSSSFYGARRSVRYTSKRTAGTFRDYMRSRSMHIDDDLAGLEQQHSEENTSSISREDSQTSYEQLHNYSRAMERMHGVKPLDTGGDYSEQSSLELCSSRSSSSKAAAQLEEDDGIFSPTQDDEDFDELDEQQLLLSRGALKLFSEASPKQIYETSTDDWYASASDQEQELSAAALTPAKCSYGNPVLECVNQILLQQSMEETPAESPKALLPKALSKSALPKPALPRRSSLSGRSNQAPPSCVASGRKRVHFSTKNSMVHVPRHDEAEDEAEQEHEMISQYQPMAATPTANNSNAHTIAETLNYESIYSNEYEPIGSERASNLYVDMDSSKSVAALAAAKAAAEAQKLCKLPPALPPKPANLLKFKKSLQQLEEVADESGGDCAASTTTATEPDYCSIAEVQIVADIHQAPSPDVASSASMDIKTEEIEEIFADIPKLPNVAAIIAPKQAVDYPLLVLPQSLPSTGGWTVPNPMPASSYKRKHVPHILAEINKRMSLPSSPTTPTAPKALPATTTTPTKSKSLIQLTDAAPLQDEFDWYNLDAEYGKTGGSESAKPVEGMLAEISEDNECVITAADEYNLDEEFSLQAEEEEEEKDEEEEEQQQLQIAPPAQAKKMKKNLASFEKFIEGSGLSTKPLPSKRKIYFSGPFV